MSCDDCGRDVHSASASCLCPRPKELASKLLADANFPQSERDLGDDHATTIGLRFQAAQAVYKMHFFGREDYRSDLIQSITMHGGFHEHSARVLGEDHPLTREIAQGFLTCFEEQLDWSLDDIPSDYLAYRARLLLVGDYL